MGKLGKRGEKKWGKIPIWENIWENLKFGTVWAELFRAETAMKAKKNHRIRNEYGDFYVVREAGLEVQDQW